MFFLVWLRPLNTAAVQSRLLTSRSPTRLNPALPVLSRRNNDTFACQLDFQSRLAPIHPATSAGVRSVVTPRQTSGASPHRRRLSLSGFHGRGRPLRQDSRRRWTGLLPDRDVGVGGDSPEQPYGTPTDEEQPAERRYRHGCRARVCQHSGPERQRRARFTGRDSTERPAFSPSFFAERFPQRTK